MGVDALSELIRLEQRRNERYKTVYLEAAEHPHLSWKAKGLHLYLMSRPPGWQIRYNDLLQRAKDSKTSLSSAIKELQDAGYLNIEPEQDKGSGHFTGSRWVVAEAVGMLGPKDAPHPRNPEYGKPGIRETRKPDNEGRSKKQVVEKNNGSRKQPPSSAEPRGRNDQTFSSEDYTAVTEAYKRITGIEPQGAEWKPIQQAIKTMFMSERTPAQIIALMEAFEASTAEWTANWTMNTVKLKLSEHLAGRLDLSSNGRRRERENLAMGHDPAIYEARVMGGRDVQKRPGTSRGHSYYLDEEAR